jgi:hypothetical protein
VAPVSLHKDRQVGWQLPRYLNSTLYPIYEDSVCMTVTWGVTLHHVRLRNTGRVTHVRGVEGLNRMPYIRQLYTSGTINT